MGCWNGTCAMSKLPIFAGDRVVCWFIVGSQGYSRGGDATNFCYPHDQFQLMPLPFRAEYNDYGSIENLDPADQQLFDLQLAIIRNHLVELDIGENTVHDIAVKKKDLDFDLATEAIHEGRLQVAGYNNPRHVGIMMILESVFNNMVNEHSWKKYEWPRGYDEPAVITVRKHDIDANAEKIKLAVVKDMSDSYLFWSESERYIREVYGAKEILRSLHDDKLPHDNELFSKVFRAIAVTNILDSFAYELRMHYGPVSGAGSQQGELGPYETLIASMQVAINNRKATTAEWEEEDEE
jgi:hypothetical protein